ncbi:MAG: hypothetical protein VZR02_05685 [Lachnospiraceae bacterium]|nr:hypothetical protein [Lachnospiraceae bacterium]
MITEENAFSSRAEICWYDPARDAYMFHSLRWCDDPLATCQSGSLPLWGSKKESSGNSPKLSPMFLI